MSMFTVVMPAHDEASGIAGFLRELCTDLGDRVAHIVVVDDCSSDDTFAVLRDLRAEGLPLLLLRNHRNLGHGPSLLRALEAGYQLGLPVVAVDSDGQFLGSDIARLCTLFEGAHFDVVEGVRTSRSDPLFRRVTSWATRVLVTRQCKVAPRDPNTPLRVYDNDALKRILYDVPPGAMTPNLMVSALVRAGTYQYAEVPVASVARRGDPEVGTWGNPSRALPSRRFVRFCWDATAEWWRFTRREDL